MKINYFTSVHMDDADAPPRHVEGTLRGFHGLGVPVSLTCPRSSNNYSLDVLDELTEFSFPKLRGGWRWFEARVALHIASISWKENDVLYFRFTPSRLVARSLRHVKAVKVLEINGTEYFDSAYADEVAEAFDLVLVEGKSIADELDSRLGDVVRVEHHVTPGVDINVFRPIDKDVSRKRLGWSPTESVCLWVSGYQAHQDVETLVSTISQLDREVVRPRFVLVGDGPRRKDVYLHIERLGLLPMVTFVDPVSHALLPTYISASDICLNLQYERVLKEANHRAFKLYEYAACGRPIIDSVYEKNETFEWLRNSSMLVRPESPDSVVEAIKIILADIDGWFCRAENTRNHVVEHRSWRAVTKSTLSRIQGVLGNNPNAL